MFLMRSVNRLAMAEPVYYRTSSLLIIAAALVVKIGMTVAYALVNRQVGSYAIKALLLDSLLDVGVTTVSLLSYTLSQRLSYAVDAWVGIAVSVAVVGVGIKMVVDNTKLLLGGEVATTRQRVADRLGSTKGIASVAELSLSDYGYRNKVGYASVVFDASLSLAEVTALCQALRAQLLQEGVRLYITPGSPEGEGRQQA